ncbi:MAG: GNAT family N-acetyltransferase [Alkalispirochaetaceae bacterium]
MSRTEAAPGLDLLTAGLAGRQRKLLTRDPWLPRSPEAVESQLREALEEGVLLLIRRATGVLGLLDSEEQVKRLLGPVISSGEWHAGAERLFRAMEAREDLSGSLVKAAVNAVNRRLWEFLEERGFRRYNAEMTLTLGREEWVPGRRAPEPPGRIAPARRIADTEAPLRGRTITRIRPFRGGDGEAIRRLHPDSAYFSAETVVARSEAGTGMTLVAVEERGRGRRVLGYLYQEIDGKNAEICFVNVEERARGRGIGTGLIAAALDLLFFKEEVELVEISVRPENPAADLYRRIGFTPVVTYYSYELRL